MCCAFAGFSIAQSAPEILQFKNRIVFNEAKEPIIAQKFLDDESKIVFVGIKTIEVWDVGNGKLIGSHQHEIPNLDKVDMALIISPDGQKAIALDTFSWRLIRKEKKVAASIWDLRTGKQIAVLERPKKSIRNARWSENGKTLVTFAGSDKDEEVCFWNGENFQFNTAILLKGLSYWNYLTRDGKTFYAQNEVPVNGISFITFSQIKSWNTKTAQIEQNFKVIGENPRIGIGLDGISSDEQFLAATSGEDIVVWAIGESDFLKYRIKPSKTGKKIYFKGFSPDGKSFAVYQEKKLNLYDSETGSLKKSVSTDKSPFTLDVRFSPDGSFLFLQECGSADVFNLETQQKSYQLKLVCKEQFEIVETVERDVDRLKFHPNGKFFLTGSDKTVRVWNITDGSLTQTMVDPNRAENKRKDNNKDDGLGASSGWLQNGDLLFASGADGKSVLLWQMSR